MSQVTLTDKEKSLAGKIALFLITLLKFLGVQSALDVLDEIVLQAKTVEAAPAPALKDVGDTLLDALATGGTLIPDVNTQTVFEKWVGIIKGAWDAIEGGSGPLLALIKGLISGHEAKKKAQAANA
jgi:hypothetical protein